MINLAELIDLVNDYAADKCVEHDSMADDTLSGLVGWALREGKVEK